MATGLFVGAAPANADFEDLLDPILQPLLTHVTDSLAGMDGAFAMDVTAWADHALAHLDSLDAATAASSSAATVDTAATPDLTTASIPISIAENTEPTIQATVDGANNTLLVDTGSGGLVIPWQELGTSHLEVLRELRAAGDHLEKAGHSGYSGGVQYTYREYNGITVDYGNGDLTTTNTPVDIVWNSHGTFGSDIRNFQEFLNSNDVTGILGIGANTGGPTESPLEAVGYTGVTVDLPGKELIIGDTNPGTAIGTVSGAPISSPVRNRDDGRQDHGFGGVRRRRLRRGLRHHTGESWCGTRQHDHGVQQPGRHRAVLLRGRHRHRRLQRAADGDIGHFDRQRRAAILPRADLYRLRQRHDDVRPPAVLGRRWFGGAFS